MSGVFPQGTGFGNRIRATRSACALRFQACHQSTGPAEHRLRRLGLGRLGPHALGLVAQRIGLLLGVCPLTVAAPLIDLPLLQVRLPAHVVDVEVGPVRIEVEDTGSHLLQQRRVVADHDQPTAYALR